MSVQGGIRRLALVVGLLMVGVALTSTGRVYAQAVPDVKAVIAMYKQALTTGDGATFASLLADNIVVYDIGTTAIGPTETIAHLQAFLAQNPGLSVSFSDTSYVLDTAIERFAFSSDPIRAAGFSRLWTIETLVVQNGKIVSYTGVWDTSDPETARFVQAMTGQ